MAIPPSTAPAASAAVEGWRVIAPAALALAGVVIGGVINVFSTMWAARQQRQYRTADEAEARRLKDEEKEVERKFARAMLARHLEAYARACAEVAWHNDDEEEEGALQPPKFPPWPEVAWPLLGAAEMMEARDIEVRAELVRERAEGEVDSDGRPGVLLRPWRTKREQVRGRSEPSFSVDTALAWFRIITLASSQGRASTSC